MTDEHELQTVKRRDFLRGVGLASAGIAGAAALEASPALAAVDDRPDAASGYRETDHVRRAYAAARF